MSIRVFVFVVSLAFAEGLKADHFDDHDLKALRSVEKLDASAKGTKFTLTELSGMPKVVQGAPQSVLLVVRTDEGNWCKLLVRGGGIKRQGSPQPKPFLQVERLVTYSADSHRGVVADKRDLYLFGGFALDLDIGQIVAKGDGDDIAFESAARGDKSPTPMESMMEREATKLGPLLGEAKVSGSSKLFIPRQAVVPPANPTKRQKTGGAVTVADFPGKYRLNVDGRFTGVLELKGEDGKLTGGFTSEQTRAVYQAAGAVGTPAHQLTLSIAFPRTDLKLDGRLFTRGRTKIAGSAVMEDNVFGFIAERID